jgi:predicted transcriptional regulator
MTQLLDRAIAAARRLSPEAQDDIARSVLFLAGEETEPVTLNAEEQAAVESGRAAVARGDFATDAEVESLLAKHGA